MERYTEFLPLELRTELGHRIENLREFCELPEAYRICRDPKFWSQKAPFDIVRSCPRDPLVWQAWYKQANVTPTILGQFLDLCGRYFMVIFFVDQGIKIPSRLVMQALYDAVVGSPTQALAFVPWLIRTKRLEDFLDYLLWNMHNSLLIKILETYDIQPSEKLVKEAGRRGLRL